MLYDDVGLAKESGHLVDGLLGGCSPQLAQLKPKDLRELRFAEPSV